MSSLTKIISALLEAPLVLLSPSARAVDVQPQAPDDGLLPQVVVLDPMDPANWEIGPIINGWMPSFNMPLHPSRHPDGWSIDFPHSTETSAPRTT